MLGRWPGAGTCGEGRVTDLGLRPQGSGVQSEGSDMADLHFEVITLAALWRMVGAARLEAGKTGC